MNSFSNHFIIKTEGHIGILHSFKNFGGVSGGPSAISEVAPKGGSLFRIFRYFNVPYKMFPVKLEGKISL